MSGIVLKDRDNGQIIDSDWFDRIHAVICGDIVPRNAGGAAQNFAATLGEPLLKWLKAHVANGYWKCGDIKKHLPYAGTAPIGQGWMLCDGRLINQASYDAEHGGGSWATYVGVSPLQGKYLPNFVMPIGALTTPQTGAAPFGATQDDHTVFNHNHKIYEKRASSLEDKTFDANGNPIDITQAYTGGTLGATHSTTTAVPADDQYTQKTDADFSFTPWGINTYFYMRVI